MYRPFDWRWTIWDSNVAVHRRERVMDHMLKPGNVGLITNRQVNGDFRHAFVTSGIIGDCAISSASKERSYLFPLRIMQAPSGTQGKLALGISTIHTNLSKEFLARVTKTLGKAATTGTAEMAFAYLYAVLSSPGFRNRYNEFLRRDFPRLPVTSDNKQFRALSKLGQELIDLHLMKTAVSTTAKFPISGSGKVDRYVATPHPKNKGKVQIFINKTQFFDDIPQVAWDYVIGGYQVARQWLKDRKGRTLSFNDLKYFGTILAVLVESDRIQKDIDKEIPSWPLPS
jgi:predicted helicase